MKEEDFVRITSRFRQVIKASITYPHLLEVMDAVVDEKPPLREVGIAEKIGMHPTMVSRYIKVIKKYAVPKIRYLSSLIGLGTLIALVRGRMEDLPKHHWIYSVTHTWKGLLVSYRYPLVIGPEFIAEELEDRAVWIHSFPFRIDSRVKVSNYINSKGELMDSAEAIKVAYETPPEVINFRYRDKPKDMFDLFLLAMLEANATLNYMDMARRLRRALRLRFPLRKVKVHLYHLVRSDVIIGYAFRALLESPICTAILMQFGSRSELVDFASNILKYPYLTTMVMNEDEGTAFALFFTRVKNVPYVIEFIREQHDFELLDFIQFSISNRLATYTLPFRNYDPLIKGWSANPVSIDKWLKEKGYVVA